jgi:hypothetical protein
MDPNAFQTVLLERMAEILAELKAIRQALEAAAPQSLQIVGTLESVVDNGPPTRARGKRN